MTESATSKGSENTPLEPHSSHRPSQLETLGERFQISLGRESGLAADTCAAYGRDLVRYTDHLKGLRIVTPQAVGHSDVETYIEQLRSRGFGSSSVGRCLCAIRRFHAFLVDENLCDHNPTARLDALTIERLPPDILSVDEARLLLESAGGVEPIPLRDRAILELLYAAGLRVSELISLPPHALDLGARAVSVQGRGARRRLIPVGREAARWLDRYSREGRPHFAGPDSDSIFFLSVRGRALSRMSVWNIIRAAALKAGIDRPVNPHTLRHSCASHLLDGGFDLGSLQQLLGHGNQATTEVYSRPTHGDLADVHRLFHPRGG